MHALVYFYCRTKDFMVQDYIICCIYFAHSTLHLTRKVTRLTGFRSVNVSHALQTHDGNKFNWCRWTGFKGKSMYVFTSLFVLIVLWWRSSWNPICFILKSFESTCLILQISLNMLGSSINYLFKQLEWSG